MGRLIQRIMLWTLISAAALLAGCPSYEGPKSPYAAMYTDQAPGASLPRHAEIKAMGLIWAFPRPVEDVWQECLQVATQYDAIVYVANKTDGTRQMILVHGQPVSVPTPIGYVPLGYPVPVFVDTWVAVSVASISSDQTEVAAAWLSPGTGRIAPISSEFAEPEMDLLTEVGIYDAICSRYKKVGQKVATRKIASEALAKKRELITQVVINKFFQELAVQLLAPQRWHKKFLARPKMASSERSLE